MSSVTTIRIGFLGAGQMARALAKGMVTSGNALGSSISACDPSDAARSAFQTLIPNSIVSDDPKRIVGSSDVVFLAVKPQHLEGLFHQLSELELQAPLFISIVAGMTIDRLRQGLRTDRIVRVMPNTPALVGAGAAAFALGPGATTADSLLVGRLLAAVGTSVQLPESLLDAVTGLSGSGPAFVYQVIEALSDGGVRVGLPRDIATQLAAQTVLGAARMVLETGEHPGVLKDRVASPGGTTIAGLHALEQGRLRGTLMDAVLRATERSQELGRPQA